MRKPQKPTVKPTKEHMDEFIELIKQGYSVEQGIPIVQGKFNLLTPHTKQTISSHLNKMGIVIDNLPKKDNGKKSLVKTAPVTNSIIKRLEDVESDIERYKTERIVDVVKSMDIFGLMELLRMGEKYPAMEQRAIVAERGYLNMLGTKEAKEREAQRQKDQKLATEVEMRQGRINPPLTGGKNVQGQMVGDVFTLHNLFYQSHHIGYEKWANLTYHIDSELLKLVPDRCLPDNITLEALFYSIELPLLFMLNERPICDCIPVCYIQQKRR